MYCTSATGMSAIRALTTSGILLYALDNIFIICQCVKRNADSAVRCSSKSSLV